MAVSPACILRTPNQSHSILVIYLVTEYNGFFNNFYEDKFTADEAVKEREFRVLKDQIRACLNNLGLWRSVQRNIDRTPNAKKEAKPCSSSVCRANNGLTDKDMGVTAVGLWGGERNKPGKQQWETGRVNFLKLLRQDWVGEWGTTLWAGLRGSSSLGKRSRFWLLESEGRGGSEEALGLRGCYDIELEIWYLYRLQKVFNMDCIIMSWVTFCFAVCWVLICLCRNPRLWSHLSHNGLLINYFSTFNS